MVFSAVDGDDVAFSGRDAGKEVYDGRVNTEGFSDDGAEVGKLARCFFRDDT